MPATMMHLAAGYDLIPGASDSFLLGCILPDCVDNDRTTKDHLHFRDVLPQIRLQSIISFAKNELDLSRDFDFGCLFHFYMDYLWDNGPQKAHRRSYEGAAWFPEYRKHLSRAGSSLAARSPWTKEVFTRLHGAEPSLYASSLPLPEKDVREFLDFNARWHVEERLPATECFPDDLVDSFLKRSRRAFRTFLEDFFPAEAHRAVNF